MSAPNALVLYSANKNILKLTDLATANLKLLLCSSTYAPNVTVSGHSILSHVTNELANGQGYTTGGVSLTGTVATVGTNDGYKLSTGDAVWTASGTGIPAFKTAVLYYNGTLWGIASPLIGHVLCDGSGADIPLTASGNTLTIKCPTNGWFDLI